MKSRLAINLLLAILLCMFVFPLAGNAAGDNYLKFTNTSGTSSAYFGNAVDMSSDYAIVGNKGAVYIFQKDAEGWNQSAVLTASDATDDFGLSVALSDNYAVVGDKSYNQKGAVYVFKKSGAAWSATSYIRKITASDGANYDEFGASVSITENTTSGDCHIIIGSARDSDNGDESGSAYVFKGKDSSWFQIAKLKPSNGLTGDKFGNAVSITEYNGIIYALIGALTVDINSVYNTGAAYIFNSTGWGTEKYRLTANDAGQEHYFGTSVAIFEETAVVSAPSINSVYVFDASNGTQLAKLQSSDILASDRFGTSVAINNDYIIAGASYKDYKGKAYIFKKSGTWSDSIETILFPDDLAVGDVFGSAVSISGSGSNYDAVIGAPGAGLNSGAAYFYSTTEFASSISDISDQTVKKSTAESPTQIDTSFAVCSNNSVIIVASSDNQALVSDDDITINGMSLPAGGLSLPSTAYCTNHDITIIPAVGGVGSANITLTITDSTNATDTTTFSVKVTDQPAISEIANQIANVSSPELSVSFTIDDPDTPPAELTVTPSSSNSSLVADTGLNIIKPTDGSNLYTLNIIPVSANAGITTITIKVNDGHSPDVTTSFTYELTDAPGISDISEQTTEEDTSKTVKFTVYDQDTITLNNISWFVTNSNLISKINVESVTCDASITDPTASCWQLIITPALHANSDKFGDSKITVYVTDGTNNTSKDFVFKVTPVDDIPLISKIDDKLINEDEADEANKTITFTVSDVDLISAGELTITATSSNPSLILDDNINITEVDDNDLLLIGPNEDKTLSLVVTPLSNQWGTATITVQVTGVSGMAEEAFVLTVEFADDDLPVINSIIDTSTTTTEGFISQIEINESSQSNNVQITVSDPDQDFVEVKVESSDPNLLPNDAAHIKIDGFASPYTVNTANGNVPLLLSLTPIAEKWGSTIITVTVTDDNLNTNNKTFLFKVNQENDVPTITPIDNQVIADNESFKEVTFDVNDLDGDTLTITANSINTTLLPNDNISIEASGNTATIATSPEQSTTLKMKLTPNVGISGSTEIIITVADNTSTAEVTFLLTVNFALKIAAIEDQLTKENTPISVNVTVSGLTSPGVEDITNITSSNPMLVPNDNISVQSLGSGFFILNITPLSNSIGDTTISVTASETVDGQTKAASESFILTVESSNNPPAMELCVDAANTNYPQTGCPTSKNLTIGSNTSFDVKFSVYDLETPANNLVVTVSSLEGLVNDGTGAISKFENLSEDTHSADLILSFEPTGIGTDTITVTIEDERSATASASFNLMVYNANNLPTIDSIRLVRAVIKEVVEDVTINPDTGTATVLGTMGESVDINEGDWIRINQDEPVKVESGAGGYNVPAGASFVVYANESTFVNEISITENSQSNPIEIVVNDIDGESIDLAVSSVTESVVPNDIEHINMDGLGNILSVTPKAFLYLWITPAADITGSSKMVVSVSDSQSVESPVTKDFLFKVLPEGGINLMPKIDSLTGPLPNSFPPPDFIEDQNIINQVVQIDENTRSQGVELKVSDGNGDPLSVSVTATTIDPPGGDLIPNDADHIDIGDQGPQLLVSMVNYSSPMTLTLIPQANMTGSAKIDILVDDNKGGTASASFNISVMPTKAPRIIFDSEVDPDNVTMDEDTTLPVDFKLSSVKGGKVKLSIKTDNPMLLPDVLDTIVAQQNSTITGTGGEIITAVDSETNEPTETFIINQGDMIRINGGYLITINSDMPALMIAAGEEVTIYEQDSHNYLLINGTGLDLNNQIILDPAVDYPLTLNIDPADNANSDMPEFGTAEIFIKVEEIEAAEPLTLERQITLTVNPVDDVPIFLNENFETITISEYNPDEIYTPVKLFQDKGIDLQIGDGDGGFLTVTAAATGSNTDIIPDENIRIYKRENTTGYMSSIEVPVTFDALVPLEIEVQPSAYKTGLATITITLSDGVNPDETMNIYINVEDTPNAPTFSEIPSDITIKEEEIIDTITFAVNDQDYDTLTILAEVIEGSDLVELIKISQEGGIVSSTVENNGQKVIGIKRGIQPGEDITLNLKLQGREDKFGKAKIRLSVTDEDNLAPPVEEFYVTIENVNDLPIIDPITGAVPGTPEETTSETVWFGVTDIDGGQLDISVNTDNGPLDKEDILIGGILSEIPPYTYIDGGTFEGMKVLMEPGKMRDFYVKIDPPKDIAGQGAFSVIISDESGDPQQATFNYNITGTPDPPNLDLDLYEAATPDTDTYTLNVKLGDVDGDKVTLTVESGNKTLLPDANISIEGGGNQADFSTIVGKPFLDNPISISISPIRGTRGTVDLYINLTDGTSNAPQKTFRLTITTITAEPEITAADTQYIESEADDQYISFLVSDQDTSETTIRAGLFLSSTSDKLEAINKDSIQLVEAGAGIYWYKALIKSNPNAVSQDASDTAAVLISVFDGEHTAEKTIKVFIGAPGTSPSIEEFNNAVITYEDEETTVGFTIVDEDTDVNTLINNLDVSPVSGQELIPSVNVLKPEYLPDDPKTDTANGRYRFSVTFTPAKNQFSVDSSDLATLRIVVSDGRLDDEEEFTVNVVGRNDTPVITGFTTQPGTALTINTEENVSKTIRFTISDVDGGQLKLSSTSSAPDLVPTVNINVTDLEGRILTAPQDVTSDSPVTLELVITPVINKVGTATITLSVQDNSGANNDTAQQVIHFIVGEVTPGDINIDKSVDLADAILALRVLAGIPDQVNIGADINGNNKIGMEEVISIMQYVAGIRGSL